jgi:hypothetical protein
MDLKDAALMLASESAAHRTVASIAQAAHDQLAQGQRVDYRLLNELLGEASGKACCALSTASTARLRMRPSSCPSARR